MVYLSSWEEFAKQAQKVYEAKPSKVRYCTRWRHRDGLLVLKITDDVQCIKYRTRSSIVLNRFDLLNRTLMAQMQNRPLPVAAPSLPQPSATLTVASVAAQGAQGAQAPVSTGKSKKKGKRK